MSKLIIKCPDCGKDMCRCSGKYFYDSHHTVVKKRVKTVLHWVKSIGVALFALSLPVWIGFAVILLREFIEK